MLRKWFRYIFSRKALGLDPEERQTMTTYSMLGGAIVMTFIVAILVWIVRWSWPKELLFALAPEILNGLFWITYGCLGLMAVMIIAQATIAVGGRFKGKIGPAEFSAETDEAVPEHNDHSRYEYKYEEYDDYIPESDRYS